jgi:L-threonylcarbamoyladenylate synthase
MAAQTVRIDPSGKNPSQLSVIIGALEKGGVIVYPTDTFYGLGASGFHAEAVLKVFRLKRRDAAKPLSLVIPDMTGMLEAVAGSIPDLLEPLAERFWPGPLTLILPASPRLPRELLGDADRIGVRIPDHAWLRSLLREASFPLTATSANLSGDPETTDPRTAARSFPEGVDLIVDGGRTAGGLASTVVDLTAATPRILREGAVPSDALRAVWE